MNRSVIARIFFVILAAIIVLRMNMYLLEIGHDKILAFIVSMCMWIAFIVSLSMQFPQKRKVNP